MAKLTHTVSGDIASFRSADKANIESLKINFLPKQEGEGDPSPTNIRPIMGWTGLNGKRCYKNLFNYDINNFELMEFNNSGTTIQRQIYHTGLKNGVFTASANIKEGNRPNYNLFNIGRIVNGSVVVDNTFINTVESVRTKNVGANEELVIIATTDSLSNSNYNMLRYDIQIEVGSNNTSIEPYSGETISISWSDHGVEYGGYIDIISGQLWQTYKGYTFNGEEYLGDYSSGFTDGIRAVSQVFDDCTGAGNLTICDKIPLETTVPYTISRLGIRIGGGTGRFYFYIPNSMFDGEATIEKFRQWLSENTPTVVAKLTDPVLVTTLTPMELQTYLDYNNIWSNTNDTTEVTYEVIDHLNQKRASIPKQKRRVLWNQIDGPMDADHWKPYTANRMNVTFENGVATVEVTTKQYGGYSVSLRNEPYPTVTTSDIYYASYMIKPEYTGRFGLEFAGGYQAAASYTATAGQWRRCSFISRGKRNASGAKYLPFPTQVDYPAEGNPVFQVKAPIYVDLTKMFGAGNEPTRTEFEELCKLNHINLEEYQAQDLEGTEQIWYINDNDKQKYQTIEWNQWAPAISSTNYKPYNATNITMTVEDGVITQTWNVVKSGYNAAICSTSAKTHALNRYYYISYEYQTDFEGYIGGQVGGQIAYSSSTPTTKNTWERFARLVKRTESGNFSNYIIYMGQFTDTTGIEIGSTCKLRNPTAIDVTQMFGEGKEPKTRAEFEEICTLNGIDFTTFYAKNTGTRQIWRMK